MEDKININVGGKVFVTTRKTVSRCPDTKLWKIMKSQSPKTENENDNEIFFDKNPKIFQSVLDYYRTGTLHINSNYCADYVKEELQFWGLTPAMLSPCCRKTLYDTENDKQGYAIIEKNFGPHEATVCTNVSDLKGGYMVGMKRRVWNFIEYPRSSRWAQVWQAFYLTFVFCGIIGCSIHCFMIQSVKETVEPVASHNATNKEVTITKAAPGLKYVLIFSFVYNTMFTLETIARVFTCPDKAEFFTSMLNLVDVGSSVAFLVFAFLSCYQDLSDDLVKVLEFSGTLVIFQGFRFYRLERFCERLRLILLSLDQSKSMLCLLTTVLAITALIFGALIHILEVKENPDDFTDPITCFYWAIITMTTVGYGDVRPKTDGGKIVASLCATFGLLLLSMPIAIVANDFSYLYTRYKERNNYEKLALKKRDARIGWKGTIVTPTYD